MVAPFTGAWIEITQLKQYGKEDQVAPFTGAWIEMRSVSDACTGSPVAPFTGAWIEMPFMAPSTSTSRGRSLHGSVD